MKGGNERGRTFGSTNYGSKRGNLGGAALKKYSLGVLGNSIAGIVGGGVGGQLLSSLIPALADGIGGQVAGGGIWRNGRHGHCRHDQVRDGEGQLSTLE